MGISPFSKSSFCSIQFNSQARKCNLNTRINETGNPNPSNFKILKHELIGHYLVVLILYPDCNNYEGRKILVYENMSLRELRKQKIIDPHFCDHDFHISPIARFIPNDIGWKYAVQFCKSEKK